MVASTNINCSGKAFHCVNSTHFMICVDMGGGVSHTIDDFIIPCPASTVCDENNVFECDFPEVTTPPLQVISVNKQSDTSEQTSVTNSETTPMPLSEKLNVYKENVTVTTLSIPEHETPVVKLEVLEDIKNPAEVNSDNTREASYKVTSSFIDSVNEVANDKQTSNTITTSATDNNKNLEPAVETSINKPLNTSSTDKSKPIDTATSVIGLINLISTDRSSVVNTKQSPDVLTSLDTFYEYIATTTEQYITKKVIIQGEKIENVTEKIHKPTEIIFNDRSSITESTTPVVNTYIENDINNTIEFNKTIDNKTNVVGNTLAKSNNTPVLVPETTTEYLAPINIINISEPVTVDVTPHTTTDITFVPLELVDFIAGDTKQNDPSTKDSINTFYSDNTTMTTDQYTTNLEITLSDKPVTVEVTTPIVNRIYQHVLKNDINTDSFAELNSTVEISSVKTPSETNIHYFTPEPITIGSEQTNTEQTFVPISSQANAMYTTETNNSLLEKNTTANQPLEIITTESSIEPTDNLYQINREINQTMITEINNTGSSTINTSHKDEAMFNASSKDIIKNQVTEATLRPLISMKNPANSTELTTGEILHNGLTAHAVEAENALHATNAPIDVVDEGYIENVKNDTLLYNVTNAMNTTKTVKTVFNASSTDNFTGKSIEPSTINHPAIEISTAETIQNGFTGYVIEASNELPTTNDQVSVNEANLKNVGIKTLLSGNTTPLPYNVASLELVTKTTRKDLISQSDIATNPPVGFTTAIIAHMSSDASSSINHGTTQNLTTDPETKIPGSLSQSQNSGIVSFLDNFNADHLNKTVFDKDVVAKTSSYWNLLENNATTPVPSDVTGKTNLSDSGKIINQTKNFVKTLLTKTILPQIPSTTYNVSELASTTSVPTTPVSIDIMKIPEQLSSYTPEIDDIYKASTTGYKYDSSNSIPIDVTYKTNIENVTDTPKTTLPTQESTSRKIGTVHLLKTTSRTTASDLVPSIVTTAEYIIHNTAYLNTISSKVNIETTSSKFDLRADFNKSESVNAIVGKNSDNYTAHSSTIKDENITTISNSSLSNDYIKTSNSQYSSTYVNATDNVPVYNLEQAGKFINQENTEGLVSFTQKNVVNSILSIPSTYKNVGTEIPLSSTLELSDVNPTTTAVHHVTEKTNHYISETEAIPTKLANLPKEEIEHSMSSVSSVTPSMTVTPDGFATVPVYDDVTTIKDSAFITSTTQTSPKEVTDNMKQIHIESPILTKIMKSQTVKQDADSALPIITTPTRSTNVFAQTTPLDKINQDVLIGITTVDLINSATSTLNNNIPQPMASLPIVGVTAAQITTEPTYTAKLLHRTTPQLATVGKTNLNQGVLPGLSTVDKNISQSIPLLPIVELTAQQLTHTTNVFAQTKPLLAVAGDTNKDFTSGITTTNFSESVMSTVNNNISKSMESPPIAKVTTSQMSTESKKAASIKTNQDVPFAIETTDLPQYETRTATYNSTQWISDITTEMTTVSLTVPDSMVETIKVVGDKVSGTDLRDITLSGVMSNTPTIVDSDNYSLKSMKNNIDHENIVIGSSPINNEQNTPITFAASVDFNRAEVVNHTESELIRSIVNIDSFKIKESSNEEEDSVSSVLKSGTDFEIITLHSDSPIISKIETKDSIPADKIEYRLTTSIKKHKTAKLGAPNNVMALIKLSLENSTINDELEQHLISTNHTVTTEVQSHLNESDKQSNKTSDQLTLNRTSMHNPNLTSIELNEGSNNNSAITVSALGFNCSNHTRGKYADKKDCRKFYTCLGNLQPMLGVCPNNTVFSEINKQCTRNLSHCVRNNQFRCLFEGRFSDFFKDNIYYICVKNRNNSFIRYKLQCQADYHINRESVKCEKNEDMSTQESSVSETNNDESNHQPKSEKNVSADGFVCKSEGKFPYVKDCSKYHVCDDIKNVYYICVKNSMNGFIRYKLQCHDGYHLNKKSVECEKNELISNHSASSVTKMNDDKSKPKPKLETKISTDDFECEAEGKFPYAKDCSKYYVCTRIRNVYLQKIKKCASEEVFDKKKKMCVENDSGEC